MICAAEAINNITHSILGYSHTVSAERLRSNVKSLQTESFSCKRNCDGIRLYVVHCRLRVVAPCSNLSPKFFFFQTGINDRA